MSIDERVRQAWRRHVPDATDAEIDAIVGFLRPGDDVTSRLVKAYRAGETVAALRCAAQLREALGPAAPATWDELLAAVTAHRPADPRGTCRTDGCDEPLNDCPQHTNEPPARIYTVCARCGHTVPECITCGVDTPILGGSIAGRRYCHTFSTQPSCYSITLGEVLT